MFQVAWFNRQYCVACGTAQSFNFRVTSIIITRSVHPFVGQTYRVSVETADVKRDEHLFAAAVFR